MIPPPNAVLYPQTKLANSSIRHTPLDCGQRSTSQKAWKASNITTPVAGGKLWAMASVEMRSPWTSRPVLVKGPQKKRKKDMASPESSDQGQSGSHESSTGQTDAQTKTWYPRRTKASVTHKGAARDRRNDAKGFGVSADTRVKKGDRQKGSRCRGKKRSDFL